MEYAFFILVLFTIAAGGVYTYCFGSAVPDYAKVEFFTEVTEFEVIESVNCISC